jgi:hypothetical protein
MNPPFTRSTAHEGKKVDVPRPMLAAFDSTDEDQRYITGDQQAYARDER